MRIHFKAAFFLLIVFMVSITPPMYYLYKYGADTAFSFLANDAFYYLAIAKNSIGVGFFTFDGQYPTNGFHPAWQYFLYYLNSCGFLGEGEASLRSVYVISVVLVGASIAIIWQSVKEKMAFPWLVFPFLIPGLSWILISPVAPGYFSVYSFQNGMESPLSLFFFSLAFLFAFKYDGSKIVFVSIFLSLAVLTRLDDVFILASVLIYCMVRDDFFKRKPLLSLVAVLVPVVLLVTYLLYNQATVGALMPLSGSEKFGWLSFLQNAMNLVLLFVPFSSTDIPLYAAGRILKYSAFQEVFMREFQMIYPAVMCGGYLLALRRGLFATMPKVLAPISAGILLKVAYNFLFVGLWRQGHWYFAVSIVFSNFIGMLFIEKAILRLVGGGLNPAAKLFSICFSGLVTIFSVNVVFNYKSNSLFGSNARSVYEQRERLASALRGEGISKFVEFDDGLIGWSTRIPAISGLGLALDKEASIARKNGNFFSVAKARGYDYAVASGEYAGFLYDLLRSNDGHIGVNLWGIKRAEFDKYQLRVVLYSQQPKFLLLKIAIK